MATDIKAPLLVHTEDLEGSGTSSDSARSYYGGVKIAEDVISPVLANEVPQGRHLGLFSTVVMFVSRIVGSGIFATPSTMFVNCGGNALLFVTVWIVAMLAAFSGLYLYLEFGCLLPRSGGPKNFLEAVYDRPRMMMSVAFASFSVLTGFTVSGAIVFGKYTLYALGFDRKYVNEDSAMCNYIGAAAVMLIVVIHGSSVKHGIIVQNILGGMKFLLIAVMSVTGIYAVFFFDTRADDQNPAYYVKSHFWESRDSSLITASSLTASFMQAFFCFSGWDGVHSVVSEVKDPVRTMRIAGPFSLLIAFGCYMLLNFAYLFVLSWEEIQGAGPLIGSILFSKLYGPTLGGKFVTLCVAVSTASNLFVVIYGTSRMNQEFFREGYLPFSKQMASNWPWGSPLPSLLCCGLITVAWLCFLPPSGAAYDYLVNFEGYSKQFFLMLIAIGLFIYRHRHPDIVAEIRASMIGVAFLAVISVYLMVGPFFGDQSGNVVGWLPPYQITTLLMFLVCFLYWLLKFVLLPRLLGYRLQALIVTLSDGLEIKRWRRRYSKQASI
ncbi:ACL073Wp [Eremothecium gossypii ATCC 10895]|uniref:ACL073Wp n=1 Tax=Eremothecium gossypii (strain ATCC 10895 / CBS 109.51 / FGSC 9923 / NRRL Y-1056) TaxID=284811 RepID=Q75CJ2_EREGS|nr:ACL073Wp [Eremothecium gossypii ATCC 10895]AAS51155.2 ACL073Wp [Eremothecium gossypii ATCC 10895]